MVVAGGFYSCVRWTVAGLLVVAVIADARGCELLLVPSLFVQFGFVCFRSIVLLYSSPWRLSAQSPITCDFLGISKCKQHRCFRKFMNLERVKQEGLEITDAFLCRKITDRGYHVLLNNAVSELMLEPEEYRLNTQFNSSTTRPMFCTMWLICWNLRLCYLLVIS